MEKTGQDKGREKAGQDRVERSRQGRTGWVAGGREGQKKGVWQEVSV